MKMLKICLFVCLFLGFNHLDVTSPDQHIGILASLSSHKPPWLFMYRGLDLQVYDGFGTFYLLRNPAPVPLVDTATLDCEGMDRQALSSHPLGCLRSSHF